MTTLRDRDPGETPRPSDDDRCDTPAATWKNPLAMRSWSPYVVGAAIGMLSWITFWSADHPIGVSTAFEYTAALAQQAVFTDAARQNPYYADKAREGKPPKINWEWMLVVGVFLGAILSSRFSGDICRTRVPQLWAGRFGTSVPLRYFAAFLGGAVMMLGARMAGGCTSGHGISGALQLALSSWVFFATFFLTGIVAALLLFGTRRTENV